MDDTLKQIRLLYVEDEESIRNILSRGIKRRVKELEVAVDGEDGFEKFKQFKPDIIVTDIKMPNMTGLEMSDKIREINKNIPIIITSAHGEVETLLEAIQKGINGYIIKPIDKDKLFDTILMYSKSIVLEKKLKIKEKELIQKNKNEALIDMIGNIAHQWRQPLSAISLNAGTIRLKKEMNILNDDELFVLTDSIENTTQELSKSIENLKTYMDNNVNINIKKEFNIEKAINNSIKFIKVLLDEKDIEIIIQCDTSCYLYGDIELFNKSILAILYNSIEEFKIDSKEKKYIFIDIEPIEDMYRLAIKDTAGGIDDTIIEKVFEPYFTTKHKTPEKGLGLYNLYNTISTQFNGSVNVQNIQFEYENNQYLGTEFIIKIEKGKDV